MRDRAREHGVNNPEYKEPPAKPIDIVDGKVEFTCRHWRGCDHVLNGTERFPGWLCDEHYSNENKGWIWPEKKTRG